MSKYRIGILSNPAANNGQAAAKIPQIRSWLQLAGFSIVELSAADPKTAYLRAKTVLPTLKAVIAIGGDGTVALAANLVAGTEVKLGVIPLGNGNDFAKAAGIPANPRAAVEIIKQEFDLSQTAVDALILNRTSEVQSIKSDKPSEKELEFSELVVLGNVCLGIDAAINIRTNRTKTPYLVASLMELIRLKKYSYKLAIDDEPELDLEVNLLTVCNSGVFGKGMKISPSSKLTDGKFEVVYVKRSNRLRLLTLFPLLLAGKHERVKLFKQRQASKVKITALKSESITATTDGEERFSPPFEINILKGAVKLISPPIH